MFSGYLTIPKTLNGKYIMYKKYLQMNMREEDTCNLNVGKKSHHLRVEFCSREKGRIC